MTGEVAPLPTDKLIGQVLANRYQIESRLGEGAMGTVYRARHVKVGRPFAVKVLHANLLEEHKAEQRFEREAELAGRLHHPNVIGVVDVGETAEGMRYMVMDFAEGQDLATLINEAPMTPQRIIHLTRQLLEGLYHAHAAGLIHRDFKPANVIVERDAHGEEVPRIVDFGISILREGGESANAQGRLTTNGLVLGTPHYMAPEQAVRDPLDHRIDLFALGIVIYEMLCGKLPFEGTGVEVARANLLVEPPRISARVPSLEVDPLLEAFARRLMAKRRDHRPPTAKAARELLDLIEKDTVAAAAALGVPLDASTPAITQPAPPPEGTGAAPTDATAQREVPTSLTAPVSWDDDGPPRSNKRAWLFAGLGLVVAGGVIALVLGAGGKTTSPPPPDEATIVKQAAPPSQPAPVPAPTPTPPPTPDTTADHRPIAPAMTDTAASPDVTKINRTKTTGIKTAIRSSGTKSTRIKTAVAATTPSATTSGATSDIDASSASMPTGPAETPGITASALAMQYGAIGRELKALQDKRGSDATAALWPRYRMIKINDALTTPEKRATAADMLSRIAAEIARQK